MLSKRRFDAISVPLRFRCANQLNDIKAAAYSTPGARARGISRQIVKRRLIEPTLLSCQRDTKQGAKQVRYLTLLLLRLIDDPINTKH
jgi:hypothetical protein